jgi:hypothetical protein
MTEEMILVELEPEKRLAQGHLQRLDEVSRRYESLWGADRLPELVSPELKERWNRQWQKLNAAILESRHGDVVDLAPGCCRAWEALERAAVASGAVAPVGRWFECRMASGGVLRVCSSALDARIPVPAGTVAYTMEEVARVLEARQLVNMPSVGHGTPSAGGVGASVSWEFLKSGGDKLPF